MTGKFQPALLSLFGRANFLLMKRRISLCLVIMFFAACSKTDEEKRLARFRKSIPYKTYRFASEKATELALDEYNKSLDFPIEPQVVHATLGFACLVTKRSEYALIEAELAKESPLATPDTAILSMGLQSVALRNLNCPHLAREQFLKLKTATASQKKTALPQQDTLESKLTLASLMIAGLYQNDAEVANLAAKRLGGNTQFGYLPSLINALIEIKRGHPQKAIGYAQELSQNKHFPESRRKAFSESLEALANTSEQMQDKDAIADGMILQLLDVLLEELFSQANQQILLKKITTLAEQFTKGFPLLQPSSIDSRESSQATPQN
jgi:hypothetical protein